MGSGRRASMAASECSVPPDSADLVVDEPDFIPVESNPTRNPAATWFPERERALS